MTAYRLETPRPRQRPDPLSFEQSSHKSMSMLNQQSPPPLLYDLPAPIAISPPTSPKTRTRVASPTSPTFIRRSGSRTPRRDQRTPPSNVQNRSVTPLGALETDLEKFSKHCHAWYFEQNQDAGHQMTQALATLPPSQRASYARLQASIRAAYHRSVSTRRTAEFRAHLSATQPGGSLTPLSRSEPTSLTARKERLDRFERFVRTWCTMGMPGPQPFFQSLWALLRMQVVPENVGGAGSSRIEWEIDDAVFKEAGGRDFMLEAIDVLKGVLAFEEICSPRRSCSTTISRTSHSRSESQPFTTDRKPAPPMVPKRARAPSDPFLDMHSPMLSRSVGSSNSGSPQAEAKSAPIPALLSDQTDDPPSPILDEYIASPRSRINEEEGDCEDEVFLRIWTAPDMPNPEFLDLLKVFPSFITRHTLPRFPQAPVTGDLEEGNDDDTARDERSVRCGTGSLWVGPRQRSPGWEGGWWARLVSWWKKTFC